MPDPWKNTADPLGEALHFLRISGSFYCLSEFTAPWALDLPSMQDCVMFHVVTTGDVGSKSRMQSPARCGPARSRSYRMVGAMF